MNGVPEALEKFTNERAHRESQPINDVHGGDDQGFTMGPAEVFNSWIKHQGEDELIIVTLIIFIEKLS